MTSWFQVDYVKQGGFGGVMVWALDLDDFSGKCGEGKYPLLTAIVDEVGADTGPVATQYVQKYIIQYYHFRIFNDVW
jgi:GH18 family chitinase